MLVFAALLTAVLPTFADTKGRQNTALALTAATIYAAFQKNKLPAIALAAGSALAWKNYGDSQKNDRRYRSYSHNRRQSYYGNSYNRPYQDNRQWSQDNRHAEAQYASHRDRTDGSTRCAYDRHHDNSRR